ncbi:MAG: SCO1664 family protein [Actinomycetota bacterium]
MISGGNERRPSAPATEDVGTRRIREDVEAIALLERGDLEVLGLLPRASNFTFLARVRDGADQTLAVYKPRSGEAPLWDFGEGTLAAREVAAFVVSDALGWPWVPPTVLRDGPHGPGSVQRFVAFDPSQHYLTMQRERPDEFRRIALFDVVANNADRKSGHCLLAEDGRIFVVDHGVCFHEEPKLRTVIWDFVGEPIARDLQTDLRALQRNLATAPLRDRLEPLLSTAEIDATARRVADLVRSPTFPEPGPGRPYPWPVV